MDTHTRYEDLLPLYVAGQLAADERTEMEHHLAACAACQADLLLWQAISAEVSSSSQAAVAPSHLAEDALRRIHAPLPLVASLRRALQLLRAQALLVQRELWPTSAAVIGLGIALALVAEKAVVVYFIAPLVAAASLTVIYGPEYDPATELAFATPTSAWKVLLARLTLVSGYNLLLALAASLALLVFMPAHLLGAIILTWLGPLTFLSALALVLALWIGTGNAVLITYGLWMAQYVPFKAAGLWALTPFWVGLLQAYQGFWHSTALLLILAMGMLGIALLSARRPMQVLGQRLA